MILSVEINNQTFKIDDSKPLDISIPLDFNGAQPNAYGVEKATSKPCEAGELVGDTRRGGSCNFEQVTFIPHCNGTHTECVGHLTRERISVRDCLKDVFIPAMLVSVEPENAFETREAYAVELNENDKLITRKAIENVLNNFKLEISDYKLTKNPKPKIQNPKSKTQNPKSLIIRTLPNDESKLAKIYTEEIPPFFSTEAMEFIVSKGVRHLLVDLPSIDRIFDEGKLSNHRIFWNVGQGEFETNEKSLIYNTITELIFVPDRIADGNYLLNLQIAPFASDASPSRPVLFRFLS